MGFIASGRKQSRAGGMPSVQLLHRLECRACPLDKIKANHNPHMVPTGTERPLIYILGEAPGKVEDRDNEQFIGKSGQKLRHHIPHQFRRQVRFNNVVRTRPRTDDGKDRPPEKIEIEACRPSVMKDIVATKPKVIFGFGNIPLHWTVGQTGIKKWRGRMTPVNVGGHLCWYFPFTHPAALLRERPKHKENASPTEIATESERVFAFDLKRAFAAIEDLPPPRVLTRKDAESDVELIPCSAEGLNRLETLLTWAAEQPDIGIDWETWRLRPYAEDALILTMGLGTEKFSFAFALDHPKATWTKTQRERIDELVRKFLLAPGCKKWSLPLRFELEWAAVMFGVDVMDSEWGCVLQHALALDERMKESRPDCTSLEFLTHMLFGLNLKELSPFNRADLRQEPLEDVLRYNAMDAKFHCMVGFALRKRVKKAKLTRVVDFDTRKVPALTLTTIKGMRVSQKVNREFRDQLEPIVAKYERLIAKLPEVAVFKARFKKDFLPSSNPQMKDMLLQIIKVQPPKPDKDTGKEVSVTDEKFLKTVDHRLARFEMKRRKASKRLSTYILPYSDDGGDKSCIWPDGLIHPIYNQPGTETDRTSAEEPNVQNYPKRDAEAKKGRRQFKAPKGFVYVSVDHGQIQGRGIAMISKDKVYVKSLWERHDIHTDWTNKIAYAYPERVGGKKHLKEWYKGGAMATFRTDVKNQWTFPSFFGSHIKSRAGYLNIPVEILEPLDRQFWKEHAGVKDWQERSWKHYLNSCEVVHMDGRINHGPLKRNDVYNYPIQGVEAQIVMDGMIKLSDRARRIGDINYQPNIEIHDDLTFCLPLDGSINKYIRRIVTDMLSADFAFINVPLAVEVSVGRDLYDMDEVLVAYSDTWEGEVIYKHKYKCGHSYESEYIIKDKECPHCHEQEAKVAA